MGGWIIIPGFWSWGLRPRPSAGVNAIRSNGSAPKIMVQTKKAVTAEVTPPTYGSSDRYRREVSSWASAPNSDSTTAQKSSDPFCPAQNAEKMYPEGRFLEV